MASIRVEISAHHVHLSEKDFIALFGEGKEISEIKKLSQKGEYASEFTLTLKSGENLIENVRILGPWRDQTQVEISMTDARRLRAEVPLRLSGDLAGSAPIKLISPNGSELELSEGLIIAKRHLHVSQTEADQFGLTEGQEVSFQVLGDRAGRLDKCAVRIKDNFSASFHVDTDEANALGLIGKSKGELIT